MTRRLWAALACVLTLTASPATAQGVGYWRSLTQPVFTGPVTGAPGTCAGGPTYRVTGALTSGFNLTVTPSGEICVGGVAVVTVTATAATFTNAATAGWSDAMFSRNAANLIAQRNGSAAQRAAWANTYTSSVSGESFDVDWQTTANVALVGTRTAATGTGRPLRLVAQATNAGTFGYLQIATSGALQTNGTVPSVSNTSAGSCGSTAATIAGNDNTGMITVGLTAGTSCTVTFTTAAVTRRQCNVNNATTANLARAVYINSTTSTFEGTFMAGDLLGYNCSVY